jgi:hypothetical protein
MVFVILMFLLPAAAVALGGAFAVTAIGFRRRAAACAAWPTVTGEIIGARADTMIDDDIMDRTDRRHRQPVVLTAASVRYAYQVAGHDYQSTRLYPGRPVFTSSLKAVAATLAKYPPHAQVAVHYNPANPAEAVLEPGNLANAHLALLAAIGFGGMGLFMLFAFWNVQ